jgi:hypothetical protein
MNRLIDLAPGIGQVHSSVRWELLDRNNTVLGLLHPEKPGQRLINETNANVHRSVTGILLSPDEANGIDFVKERARISWEYEDGTVWPLGVFLFTQRIRLRSTSGTKVQSSLFDLGHQLTFPMIDSFGVPAGGKFTDGINALLDQVHITDRSVDIADNTAITPMSFPSSATRKAALEQICQQIGFLPPYFDNLGKCIVRKLDNAALPTLRYDLENSRVINDRLADEDQTIDAPNVYVVVNNGPTNAQIRGVAYVNPAAPHSVANRGYEVPKEIRLPGVATSADAQDAANVYALRASSQFRKITFDSAPDPRHDTFDLVSFDSNTYRERRWELTLDPGGPMTHELTGAPILPGNLAL